MLIAKQVPVPEIPQELPLNVIDLPRKLLLPHEIKITETPPELLITALASGKLTCIDVTKAFLRRARVAQKMVLAALVHISSPIANGGLSSTVSMSRFQKMLLSVLGSWTGI